MLSTGTIALYFLPTDNHPCEAKTMRFQLLPIAIILLFTANAATAQPPAEPLYQKVLPGNPALQVQRMSAHTVRYKKLFGEMLYEMTEATLEGVAVYKLEIYFNQDKEGVPDIIYLDAATLGYAGRRLELDDYTVDVRFTKGRFTGNLIPTADSDYQAVVYDKAYPHGAFEPAVINYFIAALPLAEGYTASLPVFSLNNGSEMHWSNIEVLAREDIRIDGKNYTTWKVQSSGIREKTIWISEDVPYAIKMQTEGVFGTWELEP